MVGSGVTNNNNDNQHHCDNNSNKNSLYLRMEHIICQIFSKGFPYINSSQQLSEMVPFFLFLFFSFHHF